MFRKIKDFVRVWKPYEEATLSLLDSLTDDSLSQEVTPQGRTLGRIAWHMVTSIHVMMSKTGLDFATPSQDAPVPTSVKEIGEQFQKVSRAFIDEVKESWTDETLKKLNDFFGHELPNGIALLVLLQHQNHHRGQLTILMRQAGLKVRGLIGPAKEEWANLGMEAPE